MLLGTLYMQIICNSTALHLCFSAYMNEILQEGRAKKKQVKKWTQSDNKCKVMSKEQGARSREQGARSREQGAGSKRQWTRKTRKQSNGKHRGIEHYTWLVSNCPNAHCLLQFGDFPRFEVHAPQLANLNVLKYVSAGVAVLVQMFKNFSAKSKLVAEILNGHLQTWPEGRGKKHRQNRMGPRRLSCTVWSEEPQKLRRQVDVIVDLLSGLCLSIQSEMTL